jgi:putative transposase
LYQGRFKNFPVESGLHLLLLLRYVERNALRANLVERAEDWTWGSLWRRENRRGLMLLSDWPVERPVDWVEFVNEPQSAEELEALRRSVNRGCPFGEEEWVKEVVEDLGLESTIRPPGRPRKGAVKNEEAEEEG